jgi:hypothetical protein
MFHLFQEADYGNYRQSTPPAGTFKAITRNNGRIVKTKTLKSKKNARIRATRIEGDGNTPEK